MSAAATPRPSATVVLLQDGAAGPEVLLVRRHARASFGASYVFPGGLCEEGDDAVAARCDGPAPDEARRRTAGGGLAFYSAGIRELFEETGVLLARHAGADALVDGHPWDDRREPLHAGRLAWSTFLDEQDLRLACDRLHCFTWWVTPRHFRKRYSTRFFLARMPAGQQARHDGCELTDSGWQRPDEALAAARDESLSLPPPTRAVLADLATHATVDDALDWARNCEAETVDCILPAIVVAGGRERVVLPGDRDYPAELEGQQA